MAAQYEQQRENLVNQDLEPPPAPVVKECSIVLGAALMPEARWDESDMI